METTQGAVLTEQTGSCSNLVWTRYSHPERTMGWIPPNSILAAKHATLEATWAQPLPSPEGPRKGPVQQSQGQHAGGELTLGHRDTGCPLHVITAPCFPREGALPYRPLACRSLWLSVDVPSSGYPAHRCGYAHGTSRMCALTHTRSGNHPSRAAHPEPSGIRPGRPGEASKEHPVLESCGPLRGREPGICQETPLRPFPWKSHVHISRRGLGGLWERSRRRAVSTSY